MRWCSGADQETHQLSQGGIFVEGYRSGDEKRFAKKSYVKKSVSLRGIRQILSRQKKNKRFGLIGRGSGNDEPKRGRARRECMISKRESSGKKEKRFRG